MSDRTGRRNFDAQKFEGRLPVESLKSTIVAAYKHLVWTKRVAFPSVADLLREAGVARSTLYKHFDDRSAVLVEAMRAPFSVLATAAQTGQTTPGLIALLEHFWAERREAADLLATPHVSRVGKGLSAALVQTIGGLDQDDALRIAQSQLAILRLWLAGQTRCAPAEMAAILARSSFALVAASAGIPAKSADVKDI